MLLVSASYILFLTVVCIIFYLCPVKYRKLCLIPASLFFFVCGSGALVIWLLYAAAVAFWGGKGLGSQQEGPGRKAFLVMLVVLLLLPLIGFKWGALLENRLSGTQGFFAFAAPMGISFYTLAMIGYCVDIYRNECCAETNFWRVLLFCTFFPQIVQGPIARYPVLKETLYREQKFDYTDFCHGCQLILWGFFQKLVVADRLALLVDHVFAPERERTGFYVLIACFAYSFQLYADFLGCVNIALGSAQLFGIRLEQNFRQPYFASSIKDFWRRWHISLSSWLRDYIYIPLGGNRKGIVRKRVNLMVVFAVSGLWHGVGFHYFLWGLLHGLYQVIEDILPHSKAREKKTRLDILFYVFSCILTFTAVTFGWALFRADSTAHFIHLMRNLFAEWNPYIILDGGAFELIGITRTALVPAVIGLVMMFAVDIMHARQIRIRECIDRLWMPVRWVIYIGGVLLVLFTGIYGPGYSAAQFIYGRF